MNRFVSKKPNWKDHKEVILPSAELPHSWEGLNIEWSSDYKTDPVFIDQYIRPQDTDVYLFGVRYELNEASHQGEALPQGNFIEFILLEHLEGAPISHRLFQGLSVTYSSIQEKKDYISATSLTARNVAQLSFTGRPRWKATEAQWPTWSGKPMIFIGQTALRENEVTKNYLTWDQTVFLFWESTGKGSVFKITTQDLNSQSAEEHYDTED
jgi:hypothetical protein